MNKPQPMSDIDFKSRFETALADCLPKEGECHPRLREAMSHSLLGGGKRLRPRLVAAAAQMGNPDERAVLLAGAAIEMLHTYSLIHDDLPAMDDDDWRRGKPTCHKLFGEAMAILAGDALQANAFELLTEAVAISNLESADTCATLAEFAATAGPLALVGGQAGDLEPDAGFAEGGERVLWIHERKTAALIRCALTLGGRLGHLPVGEIAKLAAAGRLLGLAFQAVDDLLDLSSSREALGKTPGKDRELGKLTMPAAFGEEETASLATRYLDEALELIPARPEATTLREIASLLVNRQF